MLYHKESEIKKNELDIKIPSQIVMSDGFINRMYPIGMGYPAEEGWKDIDILSSNLAK